MSLKSLSDFIKNKPKERLFHEVRIRINGDTSQEIRDAMDYIKAFADDYKGSCDFVIYFWDA